MQFKAMVHTMNVSSSLQTGGKQQFARHVPQQRHSNSVQAVKKPYAQHRIGGRLRATTSDDAANSSSDLLFPIQDYFHLGSGDTIPMPRKRPDVGPLAEYDREEAISVQLKVGGSCTGAPACSGVGMLPTVRRPSRAALADCSCCLCAGSAGK
jgi:hypothetical protein